MTDSARALLRRLLPESLRDGARRWAGRRGLGSGLETEDRRLLEQVILPDLARRAELRRVLFVGCAWYTESYERFFPGREYWTLDLD
ncbi:MAG TPA: hypothetical protein VM490_25835, partial [Armatimonadaceae bacterium]|nr:hypothetical protein [Armatimonadaceae bacterium]